MIRLPRVNIPRNAPTTKRRKLMKVRRKVGTQVRTINPRIGGRTKKINITRIARVPER
jgi:hypothetical protein